MNLIQKEIDSILEHNSEGDGYGVDPTVEHHYTLKGQQTYTIINVCILNTILKRWLWSRSTSQPPLSN